MNAMTTLLTLHLALGKHPYEGEDESLAEGCRSMADWAKETATALEGEEIAERLNLTAPELQAALSRLATPRVDDSETRAFERRVYDVGAQALAKAGHEGIAPGRGFARTWGFFSQAGEEHGRRFFEDLGDLGLADKAQSEWKLLSGEDGD